MGGGNLVSGKSGAKGGDAVATSLLTKIMIG